MGINPQDEKRVNIDRVPVRKGIQQVQGFEETYENTLQIGPPISRDELLEEYEQLEELTRLTEASR